MPRILTALSIAIAAIAVAVVALVACQKKLSKKDRQAVCEGARIQLAEAWGVYADEVQKEVTPLKPRTDELRQLQQAAKSLSAKYPADSDVPRKLKRSVDRLAARTTAMSQYKQAGLAAVPTMRRHAAAWQTSTAAGTKSVAADNTLRAFFDAQSRYLDASHGLHNFASRLNRLQLQVNTACR